MSVIRIVIVDDHDLVREGLRAILEQDASCRVVAETGDGQDAVRLVTQLQPDIVLMDIHLPGGLGGLEATEAITRDCPSVRVIVLTQYENSEYIRRALRSGARGYLLKRGVSAQLREAIRTVHAGQRYLHPAAAGELVDLVASGRTLTDDEDDYERLTVREKQVFKLLAEGRTSREIAKYLSISLKTAMTHRTNIMEKLGMHARAELIRFAIGRGIVPVDDLTRH